MESWDFDQAVIIEARVTDRLLVEAPPGTGKTAVACARVAYLLDSNVEPSHIHLLSFTRTAVAEIRGRIKRLSKEKSRAVSVHLSTLDSETWHILRGFQDVEDATLIADYEANIESLVKLLRERDPDIISYVQRLKHLIIDEAQDLTGARAALCIELLKVILPECGCTILADPAQAIYGFTGDDKPAGTPPEKSFLQLLAEAKELKVEQLELKKLYRSASPSLEKLFLGTTRKLALEYKEGGYAELAAGIRALADGREIETDLRKIQLDDETLLLFRRRIEVWIASSFLSEAGREHRMRMPGTPPVLHPWIGITLGDFTDETIERSQFARLWAGHIDILGRFPDLTEESAWGLLERLGKRKQGPVLMAKVRSDLSRSRPPLDACLSEIGTSGPTVSTIHASKGREATNVLLMLPKSKEPDDAGAAAEESRVIYVGATRPKKFLRIGEGLFTRGGGTLASGREYRTTAGKIQVAFGYADDLDAVSCVRRRLCSEPRSHELQALLRKNLFTSTKANAYLQEGDRSFTFRVEANFEQKMVDIGVLNQVVNKDLMGAAKIAGGIGPHRIDHLTLFGARTIALSDEEIGDSAIHEPYNTSGFFLAPVIKGFSTVGFKTWRRNDG